jgi:hypothetical protein
MLCEGGSIRGRSSSVLSELWHPKPGSLSSLQQMQLQLEGIQLAEVQGDDADVESAGGRPDPSAPRCGCTCAGPIGCWSAGVGRSASSGDARAEQAEGDDGRRRSADAPRRWKARIGSGRGVRCFTKLRRPRTAAGLRAPAELCPADGSPAATGPSAGLRQRPPSAASVRRSSASLRRPPSPAGLRRPPSAAVRRARGESARRDDGG